jgi:hypothetical protein
VNPRVVHEPFRKASLMKSRHSTVGDAGTMRITRSRHARPDGMSGAYCPGQPGKSDSADGIGLAGVCNG